MTLGLAIGALFIGEAIPSVVLPVYITLNMLVCGFFVREETIPVIWKWLYNISFMQWVFSALCINQFQHQQYNQICEGARPPPHRTQEGCAGHMTDHGPYAALALRFACEAHPIFPLNAHTVCARSFRRVTAATRSLRRVRSKRCNPAAIGYHTPTSDGAERDSHLAQKGWTCHSQMRSPSTSQPTHWS
jgi:hypothetical protein